MEFQSKDLDSGAQIHVVKNTISPPFLPSCRCLSVLYSSHYTRPAIKESIYRMSGIQTHRPSWNRKPSAAYGLNGQASVTLTYPRRTSPKPSVYF